MRTLGLAVALLACAVLGLATAAQAVNVPVVNHSFEKYIGTTSGVAHTTYYEYWDIVADGAINGHLQNLGSQPTSGAADPTGWSTVETGGPDTLAHDARWGNWWSSWASGPTDGGTIMILDDRGGTQSNDYLYQTLGTVAGLKALGSKLTAQIDARSANGSGNASSDEYIAMFFRIGGVGDADTAGAWKSLLQGDWEIPTWADLGNPITGYGVAVKANPGVLAPGTVGPQNMSTFSATADLSPFNDAAVVEIVIQQHRTSTYANGRVYIDNVRVTAVPEPATLALLGLGGIGLILGRKRR